MKSYTDISQSKTLCKILPLDSADMYYWCADHYPKEDWIIEVGTPDDNYECICAWSLAALLSILPVTARLLKDGNISNTGDIKYNCECSMINIHKWFDNPVDACVAMVEKLNELKML